MNDLDELFLEVPTPPPWPRGRTVPLDIEYGIGDWERDRRLHRLARLNGACPRCARGPGEPTMRDFLRRLAHPRPIEPDEVVPEGALVTPEGERAVFMHGTPRVEDREALTRWARATLAPVGEAFAHVAKVNGAPWVRGLLWFAEDGELHLEASSLDRYLHLEVTLEHLWPPVFRGGRILDGLDERLDAPFRPFYPAPPAEASALTRLTPFVPPARPPGREVADRPGT